ncbi:MAG: hypothetical protein D6812_09585 [Deltaproteobacteria bacterium]|nr:MAG: hypothetical protein D6812_09585 [Deltaproteobacteria bacterium]
MTVRTMLTTLLPKPEIADILPFTARDSHYSGERIFTLLLMIALALCTTLLFVWSRLQVTRQEYLLSEALKEKTRLEEKQLRLREQLAKVKNPQHLTGQARALGLVYPDSEQLILVRDL